MFTVKVAYLVINLKRSNSLHLADPSCLNGVSLQSFPVASMQSLPVRSVTLLMNTLCIIATCFW